MLREQLIRTLIRLQKRNKDLHEVCSNALCYLEHTPCQTGHLRYCAAGKRLDIEKGTWLGELDNKNIYLEVK